jgi:hypothetical protein
MHHYSKMTSALLTTEPNATAASTFTLFPLLPMELRLKIWYFTFSPRILQYQLATIHLIGIITAVPGDPDCYHQFSSKSQSSQTLPMALQVCHESRSFALEHYILSFTSTSIPMILQDYPDIPPRPVYYNPEIDIVAFDELQYVTRQVEDLDSRNISAYGAAPAFKDVRRVLLTGDDWETDAELLAQHPWRATRLPKQRFFTEFFTSLDEIWIAQNFHEARGRLRLLEKVSLGNGETLQNKQRLERDLSCVMSQIPGRRVPIIKAVLSMDDMTEVVAGDESTDKQR